MKEDGEGREGGGWRIGRWKSRARGDSGGSTRRTAKDLGEEGCEGVDWGLKAKLAKVHRDSRGRK